MILSCSHISKAFGTDSILEDVSFHIEEREKAAIVGINGAGKSTLLKIIIGELPPDDGDVVLAKGKTIGYLAQHQELGGDRSIFDEVLEVKRPLIEMEAKIRRLELDMKHASGGEAPGHRAGGAHPLPGDGDEAHRRRRAGGDALPLQPSDPRV